MCSLRLATNQALPSASFRIMYKTAHTTCLIIGCDVLTMRVNNKTRTLYVQNLNRRKGKVSIVLPLQLKPEPCVMLRTIRTEVELGL